MNILADLNILSERSLPSPAQIKNLFPISSEAVETIGNTRRAIQKILAGEDDRMLVVVGPCSIHDPKAAIEYAKKLRELAVKVADSMLLVMRVYFEKPRTIGGWKGLINDPYIDNSFRIEDGLKLARKLLIDVTELGVPAATESLDLITPQYLGDLVAWSAIGARTTESQTHRELASGLSAPVGFKNGTDGNVTVAINAVKSAALSHHFLSVSNDGKCSIFETTGNKWGHIILRGGKKPNYDTASVAECEAALVAAHLRPSIMIDCSHGNSSKDHTRQPAVLDSCIEQRIAGQRSIVGLMIESNLHEGNQAIPHDLSTLKYGVSITDACIDWETTESSLLKAHKMLMDAKEEETKRAAA